MGSWQPPEVSPYAAGNAGGRESSRHQFHRRLGARWPGAILQVPGDTSATACRGLRVAARARRGLLEASLRPSGLKSRGRYSSDQDVPEIRRGIERTRQRDAGIL